MSFANPSWLWLLLALPFFLPALGRDAGRCSSPAHPPASDDRARWTRWLPAIFLIFVILALAGPRAHFGHAPVTVVVVSPQYPSPTCEKERERQRADRIQVRQWEEALRRAAPRGSRLHRIYFSPTPTVLSAGGEESATSLTEAMVTARGKIPQGGGRILLLSPSLSSDALPAADILGNTAVDAAPLPDPPLPPAEILGLSLPEILRRGQRFPVRVELHARREVRARLLLFLNGLLHAEKELQLSPGSTRAEFFDLTAHGSLARLDARLQLVEEVTAKTSGGIPSIATLPAWPGARAQAAVIVSGPPVVTWVGQEGSSSVEPSPVGTWEKGLREQGFTLQVQSWEEWQFASRPTGDILVWNGFPPHLDEAKANSLLTWIEEEGGSLLVGGGPTAFGAAPPGVLALVSPLLPVEASPRTRQEQGRAALLVVLDRSGSMAQTVGGRTKMSLANEGSARALEALSEGDAFGLVAADVVPLVVWPLEIPRDRGAVEEMVRAVEVGGGGIAIYPALQSAWQQLRTSAAGRRHLLLFADADDVEEKWEGQMAGRPGGRSALDLSAAMVADGITTSVVALGRDSDKDTAWLRELAVRGRGRFHLTDDPRQLPEIFALEAREARGLPPETTPFFAAPTALGRSLLEGIDWEAAPPLLAFNRTRSRPGSDLWLLGPEETPLLAHRRTGTGRVVAFLSEIEGPWSREWTTWPQGGAFWTQVLRLLTPSRPNRYWHVEFPSTPFGQAWMAHVFPAENPAISPAAAVGQPPSLIARTLEGEVLTPSWRALTPEHWQARFPPLESPVVLALVTPDASSRQTEVRNPPPRAPVLTGEEAVLPAWIEALGGRWNPAAVEVFRAVPGADPAVWELRPWLLLLAALTLGSMPLTVGRRWPALVSRPLKSAPVSAPFARNPPPKASRR